VSPEVRRKVTQLPGGLSVHSWRSIISSGAEDHQALGQCRSAGDRGSQRHSGARGRKRGSGPSACAVGDRVGQGRPALRGLDIVTALGRCHHEVGGLAVSLVPSRTEGGWAPGLGRDAGFPWQPWLARCQGSCANPPGAVTASGPGCEVQIGVLLQELGCLGAAGATGPLSLSVPLCPFLSLSWRWPCCCLWGQEGGHVAEVTLSLAVL
jgi:hypothetical protein